MADFDAEYHLRRHAEDELNTDGERFTADRARTLVVLGLLSLERARDVLGLYRRALALRDSSFYDDEEEGRSSPTPSTVRVVRVDRVVKAPFGDVALQWIALTDDQVRVAATITFGPGVSNHHHTPLDVTDDQATMLSLDFSGGGGQNVWHGTFAGGQGLAPTTRWIEVFDERIELPQTGPPPEVTVRSRLDPDERDPAVRAVRYLAHRLAGERHHHLRPDSAFPAVVDTIIASGSLAADSPEVIEARAVWTALTTGNVSNPQALPERWRSVLVPRPRRRRAPTGDLMVGASTPVFDGVSLVVYVLSSHRGEFRVELDGSITSSGLGSGFGDHRDLPVTCTATDDLGNHYLGRPGSWHTGSDGFGATVGYEPPLDAAATRLDLVFGTWQSEAVVTVPLRWGAAS